MYKYIVMLLLLATMTLECAGNVYVRDRTYYPVRSYYITCEGKSSKCYNTAAKYCSGKYKIILKEVQRHSFNYYVPKSCNNNAVWNRTNIKCGRNNGTYYEKKTATYPVLYLIVECLDD